MLKSGTIQSTPSNSSRPSTNPVACREGNPNSTLMVKHACMAAHDCSQTSSCSCKSLLVFDGTPEDLNEAALLEVYGTDGIEEAEQPTLMGLVGWEF